MEARVGDRITMAGEHVGQRPREGTIREVKGEAGGPPYVVEWADGHTGRYTNELLRGYCPCAGCQGHSGEIKFIAGQNAVLDAIEEVGNYGLCFTWGDGHNSGIYAYRYLRELCGCAACAPSAPATRREPLPRT